MPPELIRKPLHYDAIQRRLWIRGQRCHHGATGALLAGAGMLGLMALRVPAFTGVVAAGGLLMAHDWHDRALWFARGWQGNVAEGEREGRAARLANVTSPKASARDERLAWQAKPNSRC